MSTPTTRLDVVNLDGTADSVEIDIKRAFNFGYAGRSREEAEAHIAELSELGFPVPSQTPTIYPISTSMIRDTSAVDVRGDQTYGEVEFAVIVAAESTLITIASDHSDLLIESVSTARAKTVYPDVIAQQAWRLQDITEHWDELTLTCERLDSDGWKVVQHGAVCSLMTPDGLLAELENRSGATNLPGTLLLSGTISGEILPGAIAWKNTLEDPVLQRKLTLEYRVAEHPVEI